MHLKILIGLLILGIATASPKAAEKREAKASPQLLQDYPSAQPNYFSDVSNYYAAQSYPGQYSSRLHDVRFSPSNYGASFGNTFGQSYSQVPASGYYQSSQQIPVPEAYSSGFSASDLQSANYYGAGKLWPKNFVSPTGSPSPAPVNSQLYYPSSAASPIAYQSASNYGYSLFGNSQTPVSTPSPIQAQKLIPVPVKVGLRNSFQPEVTNYNTAPQNIAVPVSTPATFLANNFQQQSTFAPLVKSYQQQTSIPYSAFRQHATSAPFAAQYQQPIASPYMFNHRQYSNPAPFKVSYQQQSAPAPYQVKYQLPTVSARSSFAAYQQKPAVSAYTAEYQQPAVAQFGAHYQQPLTSPFSANYQRISAPVAFPQNNIQIQPTEPTLTYPVTASVPAQSVSITENSIVPTILTPIETPKATIIKSEYNSGTVLPQYNHAQLYSTPSSFASASNAYLPQSIGRSNYGLSYAPFKNYASYSPFSQANYNGLGHSYSY